MEFMGYVRPDGKVGARNYVAVIPPKGTKPEEITLEACMKIIQTSKK